MNLSVMKDEHARTIARAAILIFRVKRGFGRLIQRLRKITLPGFRLSLDVEAYLIPNVFETERDVIRALETKLKWVYCREIGSDSIVGLEQCDAFYDWVARLDHPRPDAKYVLSEFDRQVIALALMEVAVRRRCGKVHGLVKEVAARIDATEFLEEHDDTRTQARQQRRDRHHGRDADDDAQHGEQRPETMRADLRERKFNVLNGADGHARERLPRIVAAPTRLP